MKRQLRKIIGVFVLVFLVVSLQAVSAKLQHDLVEVTTVNPHIRLDIRYATKNNFTNQVIYSSAKCYVRRAVAEKLNRVQQALERRGFGLKIYDGYRPLSAQRKLWSICPDERYVAQPGKGSKHNRGASVDLTLVDNKTGREVAMPSQFDDFTPRAHRDYVHMRADAKKNCKLLEAVMVKYGFEPYYHEWWHFNDVQWARYEILDIPIELLG